MRIKAHCHGIRWLLKPMVETVDRYGLKKHCLKKHLKFVERFYRQMERIGYPE